VLPVVPSVAPPAVVPHAAGSRELQSGKRKYIAIGAAALVALLLVAGLLASGRFRQTARDGKDAETKPLADAGESKTVNDSKLTAQLPDKPSVPVGRADAGATAAEPTGSEQGNTLPIRLSLVGQHVQPINPDKGVPDISYSKSAGFTAKEASWLAEVDTTENGKAVTHTFTQGEKSLAVIKLPNDSGTLCGKDGNWQSTVGLGLSFFNGSGTMRFALIDLKGSQAKAKPAEARISNWVEIPILVGQAQAASQPATGNATAARQGEQQKSGRTVEDELPPRAGERTTQPSVPDKVQPGIAVPQTPIAAASSVKVGEQDKSTPVSADIQIRWEENVKEPIDFAQAPAIAYQKAPTVANQKVLVKVRASYKDAYGQTEEAIVNCFIPIEVPNAKGTITGGAWMFIAKLGLQNFAKLEGSGVIRVALFELVSKPGSKNEVEHGRQLSNWIDLPITLPSLKSGFSF
jgi:hypothetical protein